MFGWTRRGRWDSSRREFELARVCEQGLEGARECVRVGGWHEEARALEAFAKRSNIGHERRHSQLEGLIEDEAVGLEAGRGKAREVDAKLGEFAPFVASVKGDGQAFC